MTEKDDIKEYYIDNSDLHFELSVFQKFESQGYDVKHGGRYIDGITGKMREYDILVRAQKPTLNGLTESVKFNQVEFVIECKNVRPDCPVIVGSRPVHIDFVNYVLLKRSSNGEISAGDAYINVPRMWSFPSCFGHYFIEEIGVEVFQVARDKNNKLKAVDRESIYDKWSQSVMHAVFRYNEFYKSFVLDKAYHEKSAWCVPIMVVPDGSLLRAVRTKTLELEEINGIAVKVDSPFEIRGYSGPLPTISNYYIFTETGLGEFVRMFS